MEEEDGPKFEEEARARRAKRQSVERRKSRDDKTRASFDGGKQGKHRNSKEKERREDGQGARRHSLTDPGEENEGVQKARRSSLPANELIYDAPPTWSYNFVDYFLKAEGGVPSVLTLSEAKQEHEKKCEKILSKMPKWKRDKAEEFFNSIIEVVQVKFPEDNNMDIKRYHLKRHVQPVMEGLKLDAEAELHSILQYHEYILSVVHYLENKLTDRRSPVNPEALIDIDTHLMAGIMTRFYTVFIRFKDMLVRMAADPTHPHFVKSDECVRQLKKLILAIYTVIAGLDVTFNKALISQKPIMPRPEDFDHYSHEMLIRKKHARHSVTWAARSITTILLYFHLQTEMTKV